MRRNKKGFTVAELLVVIVIISLLAAFVVPKIYTGMAGKKQDIARSKMAIIENAIGMFYIDCERFPTDDEGLEALLSPPADVEEKWSKPYLKKSDLLDPWGNPYAYFEQGEQNIGSYDLTSYGADGQPGGEGNNADIYND